VGLGVRVLEGLTLLLLDAMIDMEEVSEAV
jgi:hypothetical protein